MTYILYIICVFYTISSTSPTSFTSSTPSTLSTLCAQYTYITVTITIITIITIINITITTIINITITTSINITISTTTTTTTTTTTATIIIIIIIIIVIAPTRLLQCHLHSHDCTGVLSLHLYPLHLNFSRSTSLQVPTLSCAGELLGTGWYTAIATQELLLSYTGVVAQELLHSCCYSYKVACISSVYSSPMAAGGCPYRNVALVGDRACRTLKRLVKCEFSGPPHHPFAA